MTKGIIWFLFFAVVVVVDLSVSLVLALILKSAGTFLAATFIIFIDISGLTLYLGWKQVTEKEEWLIHLFGKYIKTWTPGLNILFPYFGWMEIYAKVFMGEQLMQLNMDDGVEEGYGKGSVEFFDSSAPVIAYVYFTVIDSKKATYAVENVYKAIEEKVDNAIRTFLIQFSLDEALAIKIQFELENILNGDSPDRNLTAIPPTIKMPLKKNLEQIFTWTDIRDRYGVIINNIVISDIILPESLTTTRQRILTAQKDKEAALLEKDVTITKAEAEKQAAILRAEGQEETLNKIGLGLAKQVEFLISKGLTKRQAAIYLAERIKWENAGDKTVIIETGSGSIAGLGAQFATGMKTSNPPATTKP